MHVSRSDFCLQIMRLPMPHTCSLYHQPYGSCIKTSKHLMQGCYSYMESLDVQRQVLQVRHCSYLWYGMQASSYTAGTQTYTFSQPCDYFTYGKAKASTLSLSVLVAIEMFNAMNALSEVSCLHRFLVDLLIACFFTCIQHLRSSFYIYVNPQAFECMRTKDNM